MKALRSLFRSSTLLLLSCVLLMSMGFPHTSSDGAKTRHISYAFWSCRANSAMPLDSSQPAEPQLKEDRQTRTCLSPLSALINAR